VGKKTPDFLKWMSEIIKVEPACRQRQGGRSTENKGVSLRLMTVFSTSPTKRLVFSGVH
jgi:hypothetical protein